MAYTWDDAKARGRRVTQYFEMFAIARCTTTAGCRHARSPWLTSATATFDDDTWVDAKSSVS